MTSASNRLRLARLRNDADEGDQTTLDFAGNVDHAENQKRFTEMPALDGVPTLQVDIPESISSLGYGSHQFFRYYGKFPSLLGREIIAKFAAPGARVLDIFNGSGTTAVEAQIAGYQSFGLDINPLAVLASNVKTAYVDRVALRQELDAFMRRVPARSEWRPEIRRGNLSKWFLDETADELARLHDAVAATEPGFTREFLALAFAAIIRRVSTAYDGEVRPHFNPDKKQRSAVEAFELKALDMLAGFADLDQRRPVGVSSRAIVGDNRDPAVYSELLGAEEADLVIAHPPYLNSFNYLQVYAQEFAWTERAVQALEQKAWPATNEKVLTGYYANLRATFKAATSSMRSGGVMAVVVGDATIRGALEPVHLNVWKDLLAEGLEPVQIWYRTTHYGIGKYAYSDRADYHGEAEKRDAILFVRQP